MSKSVSATRKGPGIIPRDKGTKVVINPRTGEKFEASYRKRRGPAEQTKALNSRGILSYAKHDRLVRERLAGKTTDEEGTSVTLSKKAAGP